MAPLEVSRVLCAEGARWLAVSSVDEGVEPALRRHPRARILVMGGFLPYEGEALVEYDLTPAVHSLEQMREVDQLAAQLGEAARAITSRSIPAWAGWARAPPPPRSSRRSRDTRHAQLEGLMTHFASAADYTADQTDRATRLFPRVCEPCATAGITAAHLIRPAPTRSGTAASKAGTTWSAPAMRSTATFPGARRRPRQLLDVGPALTWKAKMLAVKDMPEGALVGYGGAFARLAPCASASSARGMPTACSTASPIAARSLPTAKLDADPRHHFDGPDHHRSEPHRRSGPGDDVTLLGAEGDARLDAQQIARVAGTISYNILCSISARVRRVYV